VSNLFYGVPIHGYVSLNMGGIGLLNDALGGVELTVMQDLNVQNRNVHLTEGETKVLSGEEAYVYVRSRDTTQFDSASDRLARQEQYLNKMIPVMLKKIRRASSAVSVYGASEDYIYSNVDYSKLADELSGVTYDSLEGIRDIPGEVVMGEQLEEFHADDDGLYQLVLDVFYDKV
jgi:anionic cell wall polymer biosynthesis LytR-Cps2A-Psr (LCP) family protein